LLNLKSIRILCLKIRIPDSVEINCATPLSTHLYRFTCRDKTSADNFQVWPQDSEKHCRWMGGTRNFLSGLVFYECPV
jgi:hypothetical protein